MCRPRGVSGTLRVAAQPNCQRVEMEASSSFLMTLGFASLAISWALLLIASWREEYAWGMCSLLFPPLGYAYALVRLDTAGSALAFAALGWILIWLGW